ncbi:MAG TPA: hypothetical protein VLG38_03685 [Gammaproteobacteria bacterium]|nr:hypothetical protein [Gammaproteobacteria bacterium]
MNDNNDEIRLAVKIDVTTLYGDIPGLEYAELPPPSDFYKQFIAKDLTPQAGTNKPGKSRSR